MINNSRNIFTQKNNNNTSFSNSEDLTTLKIIKQLKRNEFELTKDLSKLIQNEKMIKDESYLQLVNGNPKNIGIEKKKLQIELKKIYEDKNIYLSRLNEIKYRINSIEDKYTKEIGIFNNNCKEKLNTFLLNQTNIKRNNKINARLKMLQKQNNRLLLNMNTDAENKIKEKQNQLDLEQKQQIDNNLKLLDKKRHEIKEEIMKRKNKINKEKKKMEEYLNNKLENKEYLYQKINSNFNQKIEKIIALENKKRRKLMNSIELSNINDFMKNYGIFKVKKNLELEEKTKILKKAWSERELLIPKYKNEFSVLVDEEEKNKKMEKKMTINKINAMKNKQINYSKQFEDSLIMTNKQYNFINNNNSDNNIKGYKKKDNQKQNIKFNNIRGYCNSIRNKILIKKSTEAKSLLKINPNHIDLTKEHNSFNQLNTPNLKLPNINQNNKAQISNINNEIKFTKLSKNPEVFKLKNKKEIQNIIEKNGINEITFEMINSKLKNMKEKKEEKALLLKHQGGIASNPDLGEKVCDILIDSMNAKLLLMDEIKKRVKKRNKNTMADKGTEINENYKNEENEEEKEEDGEKPD